MSYHGMALYDPEDEVFVPMARNPEYGISETGHIMHNGKIIKPRKGDKHGHQSISLYDPKTKKREYYYIHRLMMETYKPNHSTEQEIIRHLDDDPTNNRLDNLAYGTMRDNHLDCVRNGNYRKFTSEDRELSYSMSRTPIVAINLETNERLIFKSQNDASKELNIWQANIFKVLNGERKQAGGYIFKYAKGDSDE